MNALFNRLFSKEREKNAKISLEQNVFRKKKYFSYSNYTSLIKLKESGKA